MKLSKGMLSLSVFLMISIGLFGHFFNDYMKVKAENIVKNRIDDYLQDLLDRIKNRRNILLTAAVILSKDKDVGKCLQKLEETSCVEHLLRIQNSFSKINFAEGMKIHLHTKDFKSFFRVWDVNDKGDNLSLFRDSLELIKDTKKEVSGIEIGRFSMLIRGISPVITHRDEYLGSIEVMSDFSSITGYFKKSDIDFFVLMYKKYQQVAIKIDYPINRRVGKFIVINSVNSEINSFRDIEFKDTGYKITKNYYVIYTPIYDIMGEKIGFYVLKILKKKLL